MREKMIYVFVGQCNVGKSTLAKMLSEERKISTYSIGDLIISKGREFGFENMLEWIKKDKKGYEKFRNYFFDQTIKEAKQKYAMIYEAINNHSDFEILTAAFGRKEIILIEVRASEKNRRIYFEDKHFKKKAIGIKPSFETFEEYDEYRKLQGLNEFLMHYQTNILIINDGLISDAYHELTEKIGTIHQDYIKNLGLL